MKDDERFGAADFWQCVGMALLGAGLMLLLLLADKGVI